EERTVGSKGPMTLSQLAALRIVALQRGSGFRRHLEEAFAAHALPFRPAVEVGNLSLIRRFVAAGLGVAPVPSIAFDPAAHFKGVARRRVRGIPSVPYAVATRQGVPPSSIAIQLLDLLRR